MMGDATEEQNLNETGNPKSRIKKDEVEAAFENTNLNGHESCHGAKIDLSLTTLSTL
jgi:hypothetical protein